MTEQVTFKYDIFLSFSSKDQTKARKIWGQLTNSDLQVFWSDNTLKKQVGESWFDKVEKSLEQSQHMVVLITRNSLESEWVLREYKAFLHSCYTGNLRKLIPLLDHNIEVRDLPLFMREFQSFNLSDKESISGIGSLLGETSLRLKRLKEIRQKEDAEKETESIRRNEQSKLSGLSDSKFDFETDLYIDDRDKNRYRTIKVGNLEWFAENLRYASNESKLFKNIESYSRTYGRLYTWTDAINSCPQEWRIPDYADWEDLLNYFGGSKIAGEALKHSHPVFSNESELENDLNSGFSIIFGGMAYRDTFAKMKRGAFFWSSDEYDFEKAWRYSFYIDRKEISKDYYEKTLFYSVRCVRDLF